MRYFLISIVSVLFWFSPLFAADRGLSIHEKSMDNSVTAAIENGSGEAVADGSVDKDILKPVKPAGETKVSPRGRISSMVLLLSAVLFAFAGSHFARLPVTRTSTALAKYTSRMFLLTLFYLILKNIDSWLEFTLSFVSWGPYQEFISAAVGNFRGDNYEYFFKYFVDYYWAVCLVLGFPYFYYRGLDIPAENDKYVNFARTLYSLPGVFGNQKIFWNKQAKLGMLTTGVKIFYIPLLISWTINNAGYQRQLTSDFRWVFTAVNEYLTALFLYIDSVVFAFGYLVESKNLKSEIKTVEPTVLGWVVCLWCYPPFNLFSFRIFDFKVVDIAYQYSPWVEGTVAVLITLLWGIFAWASVALGFKASNLTNRGIVKAGPYRFVRHPAYAAKLMLWILQGIFLGKFLIGGMLGFIVIYALRAWTEERHLSMDPEYGKYKKLVRWRFIPGVL